jgi:hypothetical protein
MASNGDITHIKVFGKFSIPGGGHSRDGVAQNNKVMVWGEIKGTHEDTYGLNFSAATALAGGFAAIGLETCDVIKFDVVSSNGVYNTEAAMFTAGIDRVNAAGTGGDIFVTIDGTTNPTAGHVVILRFMAVGNSNAAPALT